MLATQHVGQPAFGGLCVVDAPVERPYGLARLNLFAGPREFAIVARPPARHRPSVPRRPQLEPQQILGSIQLGDPPLEHDAARAGHRHPVAVRPGLTGVADELAVSLVVLDEGG